MGDYYLGEIRAFAFGYVPANWMACNGQLLPVASNQALFAIIGTTYGGDGKVNFQLPNLNGAFVLGAGVDISNGVKHAPGETTARPSVSLTESQMPQHTHTATYAASSGNMKFSVNAADKYGAVTSPNGNMLARSGVNASIPVSTYAAASTSGALLNGVSVNGGSYQGGAVSVHPVGGAPVPIMPPYVSVTYAIAIRGIFPPRA